MRITSPPEGACVKLDQIDLADVNLYTTGDAHLVWRTLRAECPVFWQERAGGEGFWAVTRQADVRRVLAEHATFTSEGGTAIAMLDATDPAAGKMMQSTDPPRHYGLRQQIGKPFAPHDIRSHAEYIKSLVQKVLVPAYDGEVWDSASSFVRLPMAVGAKMMGLPESDVDPLLRLAYASLAPHDPHYSTRTKVETATIAHCEIIRYFTDRINERRCRPGDDVITHLMAVEIDGRVLNHEEVLLNCLSLLLGAVVTTSHAINATFAALAERGAGEGRWSADMPVDLAVEEALRWSSPVMHFMRRARRDVEMHGRQIRAGDAVTAWIASANRDEAVFSEPYTLDFGRTPNRHMAFGAGSHLCLGSHLARLMLRESFRELIAAIESFELADEPRHLVSNEIAGFVSLQLRLTLRKEWLRGA
jgi:cytochrome P450